MPVLTADQQRAIIKGLQRGLPDNLIAKHLDGVKPIDVYNYRHLNEISSDAVLESKYANWIRLIESGKSLEEIGLLYEVKPKSIRQILTRRYGYKYSDVLKRKKAEERSKAVDSISVSNFDW